MHPYCYSPIPIENYRIKALEACEASFIISQGPKIAGPLWNLFWLSVPSIDKLAEHASSERWFLHYRATDKALLALRREVRNDPVLELKLNLHPNRFLEWFKREDHEGCYDSAYFELGGQEWVETVKRRAAEAAQRIAYTLPEEMQGKNIYAFIQRPRANDTAGQGSSALPLPGADRASSVANGGDQPAS